MKMEKRSGDYDGKEDLKKNKDKSKKRKKKKQNTTKNSAKTRNASKTKDQLTQWETSTPDRKKHKIKQKAAS